MKPRTLALLIITLTTCLPDPKPKTQTQGNVESPPFPQLSSQNPLALSKQSQLGLGGTLLILNPDGDKHLLADLIRASEDIRTNWAHWTVFKETTLYNEIDILGLLDKKIDELRNDLDHFLKHEAETETISDQEKTQGARQWLSTTVDSLPSPDQEPFLKMFKLYCEAKIMQSALHLSGLARTYSKRPSPFGLCEAIYQDQSNTYFTDPSCQENSGESNYLICLWRTVLSTKWIQLHPNRLAIESTVNTLLQPENVEYFEKAIRLDTSENGVYNAISRGNYTKFLTTNPKYLPSRRIMSRELLVGSVDSAKRDNFLAKCGASFTNEALSGLCGAFAISKQQRQSLDESISLTPLTYIELIENRDNGTLPTNQISDFDLPDSTYSFKEKIHFFAKRADFYKDSESDNAMNPILAGPPYDVSPSAWITENRNRLQQELSSFYPKLSATSQRMADDMQASISQLLENRNQYETTWLTLARDRDRSSVRGFQMANAIADNDQPTALAFLKVNLVLNYSGSQLTAELWGSEGVTNHQHRVVGCIDTQVTQPQPVPSCLPASDDTTTLYPADLSYDRQSGKLTFKFAGEVATQIGLGYRERSTTPDINPDPFNDFSDKYLIGRTFTLELYSNSLLGSYEIMTGEILILEDGKELHSGGISLWQQDF